jgi:hypothetical protein
MSVEPDAFPPSGALPTPAPARWERADLPIGTRARRWPPASPWTNAPRGPIACPRILAGTFWREAQAFARFQWFK